MKFTIQKKEGERWGGGGKLDLIPLASPKESGESPTLRLLDDTCIVEHLWL